MNNNIIILKEIHRCFCVVLSGTRKSKEKTLKRQDCSSLIIIITKIFVQSLLQRHANVIDEIKGFADDVNRLREQSKLVESSEATAQVR